MQREWIATATFGLEAVVRRELEQLGYPIIKTEDGKVTFSGDEQAAAVSNLWLRCADRVLLKMGEFTATTFEELFQLVGGIAWEELIPLKGKVVVTCTSTKSALHNEPACQSICAKAIYQRLLDRYGLLPEGTAGAPGNAWERSAGDAVWEEEERTAGLYKVRLTLKKDVVTVAVDTTGDGLHKRGYRIKNVAAPVKETLAAALVELSFYKKDRLLVDFCTGSGTIPIEAAMIARNMAPGLSRNFVCEAWDILPEGTFKKARKEAFEAIDLTTPLRITGLDIDPKAVAAAKANAEAAGVDEDITFVTGDMADYQAEDKNGIAVFNPPYGERIGEAEELAHIYGGLHRFMTDNPDWSFFFITTDKEVEKTLGREANRRRKLYNGRLETCYYQYHGEKPAKT